MLWGCGLRGREPRRAKRTGGWDVAKYLAAARAHGIRAAREIEGAGSKFATAAAHERRARANPFDRRPQTFAPAGRPASNPYQGVAITRSGVSSAYAKEEAWKGRRCHYGSEDQRQRLFREHRAEPIGLARGPLRGRLGEDVEALSNEPRIGPAAREGDQELSLPARARIYRPGAPNEIRRTSSIQAVRGLWKGGAGDCFAALAMDGCRAKGAQRKAIYGVAVRTSPGF